jgi:2,3-bisphosphoglycerate-independent phosphoglycerate mutase
MVHSHIRHFGALLEAARAAGVERVYLHPSTDGRDVPDGTAARHLDDLEALAGRVGVGRVASVIGRAYTMDRGGNWALTEAAFGLIARGRGAPIRRPGEAAAAASEAGRPDEKVAPSVVVDAAGQPIGPIADGDALLCVNFRGDRMRQLLQPFTAEQFDGFDRGPRPRIDVLTLTEYFATPPVPALFPQAGAAGGLPDLLEHHGVRNLRVAESEKFPHVTFFLDGRDERRREGEEHVHVASPKGVDYRDAPELSAAAVTDRIVDAIGRDDVGLVIANLCNADVVGHTGDFEAVKQAVRTVDACVARVHEAAERAGRWLALVGDHGNAEVMWDPATGKAHVGHTTNPVPFVLADPRDGVALRPDGTLADVAPTIAGLLGLPTGGMGGQSLRRPVVVAPFAGAGDGR